MVRGRLQAFTGSLQVSVRYRLQVIAGRLHVIEGSRLQVVAGGLMVVPGRSPLRCRLVTGRLLVGHR